MAHRITSPFGTISIAPGQHDSLIEQVFHGPGEMHREPEHNRLPVDIFEDDAKLVVTASLPGIAKEDVHVSLTEGVLTINAESKPDESRAEEGHWLRRERRHGQYVRTIHLTGSFNAEKISASLTAGVLEVTIPKPSKTKSVTIDISEE